MKQFLGIVCLILMLNSCRTVVRFSKDAGVSVRKGSSSEIKEFIGMRYKGKASFYADKFEGRQTSNGEIFRQSELTAAHRTLPFNSMLMVTNLRNGKKVIVRVNDRGPFVDDRILDLSKSAAETLDFVRLGTTDVEIEVINGNEIR